MRSAAALRVNYCDMLLDATLSGLGLSIALSACAKGEVTEGPPNVLRVQDDWEAKAAADFVAACKVVCARG